VVKGHIAKTFPAVMDVSEAAVSTNKRKLNEAMMTAMKVHVQLPPAYLVCDSFN